MSARKQTKAAWQKAMWEKTAEAQSAEIARKHGDAAAKTANYGWGDASGGGRVSVATKVYLPGGAKVLQTTADYPSEELSHEWQGY